MCDFNKELQYIDEDEEYLQKHLSIQNPQGASTGKNTDLVDDTSHHIRKRSGDEVMISVTDEKEISDGDKVMSDTEELQSTNEVMSNINSETQEILSEDPEFDDAKSAVNNAINTLDAARYSVKILDDASKTLFDTSIDDKVLDVQENGQRLNMANQKIQDFKQKVNMANEALKEVTESVTTAQEKLDEIIIEDDDIPSYEPQKTKLSYSLIKSHMSQDIELDYENNLYICRFFFNIGNVPTITRQMIENEILMHNDYNPDTAFKDYDYSFMEEGVDQPFHIKSIKHLIIYGNFEGDFDVDQAYALSNT